MIQKCNAAAAPHHVLFEAKINIFIDEIDRKKNFWTETERKAYQGWKMNDASGYLPGNLTTGCIKRLQAGGYRIDTVLEGAIAQLQPFYGEGALVTIKDFEKAYKATRAPSNLYKNLWHPKNKKSYNLIQSLPKTAWVGNDGATFANLNNKVYAPKESVDDVSITEFVSTFINRLNAFCYYHDYRFGKL